MSKNRNKINIQTSDAKSFDSFTNFVAKLGLNTQNMQSYGQNYLAPFVSRNRLDLEASYRNSWLVGQVVDTIAEDMTREGITMNSKMQPDDISKVQSALVEYDIWHTICNAIKWARLYGGAIVVILTEGADYEKPLNFDLIGKNRFKGLVVLDRWQISPSFGELVTELGTELGKPKYYETLPGISSLPAMKIHHSRVLRFDGIELPYYQKLSENLWGLSVVERMYDRLIAFDSATAGASQLLHKAHLRVIGVDGFREALALGGKTEEAVIKQFNYIRLMQTIEGLTVLDAKDNFTVHPYSFSGISDLLIQFGEQISGATGVPLVRLFGQSPAGLNSTGESDLRNYYDHIMKLQVNQLTKHIRVILEIMSRSVVGKTLPEDFEFEFNPLWQLSNTEKSQIASSIVTSIVQAHQEGLITKKIAMKELLQQSRVTGTFTNITEEDIDSAVEEAPGHEMMEGLAPVEQDEAVEGKSLEELESSLQELGKSKTLKEIEADLNKLKTDKNKSIEELENELKELQGEKKSLEELENELKELSNFNHEGKSELDKLQEELNSLKTSDEGVVSKVRKFFKDGFFSSALKWAMVYFLLKPKKDEKEILKTPEYKFKDEEEIKLDKTDFQGIPITIENPVGSIRKWKHDGKEGETRMFYAYGFLNGTKGADGDEVDVFIGNNPFSANAFVIQSKTNGKYDEDKVFLGFDNETQARDAFLAHYQDHTYLGNITAMSLTEFKEKLRVEGQVGEKITKSNMEVLLELQQQLKDIRSNVQNIQKT
jgi:uncharacterized protein